MDHLFQLISLFSKITTYCQYNLWLQIFDSKKNCVYWYRMPAISEAFFLLFWKPWSVSSPTTELWRITSRLIYLLTLWCWRSINLVCCNQNEITNLIKSLKPQVVILSLSKGRLQGNLPHNPPFDRLRMTARFAMFALARAPFISLPFAFDAGTTNFSQNDERLFNNRHL